MCAEVTGNLPNYTQELAKAVILTYKLMQGLHMAVSEWMHSTVSISRSTWL